MDDCRPIAEEPMAAKTKEPEPTIMNQDQKAVVEALKIICATLEPLTERERVRTLGAVAVLFGIEETPLRYRDDE